eukprot:TRINITY_DN793_c0_g1_i3.p2 TRINITY_DN793_c0_g1~~TRINITY_DN793_c0_g1_i3.p2  ORF type:complete len:183 (+),score=0.24 TRINITY_DN793_c0_g1_i3:647-1195(+)
MVTLNSEQQYWISRNKGNWICTAEKQDTDYAEPQYVSCFILLLFLIGYNNIGDEGAKEIGFALQKNNALTTLTLGMSFVWHYCYASQRKMQLDIKGQKKLDLHCRRIKHQKRQIIVGLTFALLLLFIGGNDIGDEGTKEIGFALQTNNVLTTLSLSMPFVQYYPPQEKIILDMKEQRQLAQH